MVAGVIDCGGCTAMAILKPSELLSTVDAAHLPSPILAPPKHGADIAEASQRYGIAIEDWLDLSTGINPRAYPIDVIDPGLFQHLPLDDNDLCSAARAYCDAPAIPVAASGSQVLIQWLPLLAKKLLRPHNNNNYGCRVAVPSIGYSEHAFRWQWAEHEIIYYDPREAGSIDSLLQHAAIDVLIVINAHNPLATLIEPAQILAWRAQLAQRGGWLIVDEAFVDPTPQYSVVQYTQLAGLIVLRSLGKFFGLAGVRCGFAFCAGSIAEPLRVAVGPWAVAGPTLAVATEALGDTAWQFAMRDELIDISAANVELLTTANWAAAAQIYRHRLFNSVTLVPELAIDIADRLARCGIRVRRVEVDTETSLLRFGLVDPADSAAWLRLEQAVVAVP
jgi:cobalamin biosynthetic protein CobC